MLMHLNRSFLLHGKLIWTSDPSCAISNNRPVSLSYTHTAWLFLFLFPCLVLTMMLMFIKHPDVVTGFYVLCVYFVMWHGRSAPAPARRLTIGRWDVWVRTLSSETSGRPRCCRYIGDFLLAKYVPILPSFICISNWKIKVKEVFKVNTWWKKPVWEGKKPHKPCCTSDTAAPEGRDNKNAFQ